MCVCVFECRGRQTDLSFFFFGEFLATAKMAFFTFAGSCVCISPKRACTAATVSFIPVGDWMGG